MSKNIKINSIIDLVDELKVKKIPQNEYVLWYFHYMESKAREKHIPITGFFELTPLCNLDCKMCYIHLTSSQFSKQKLLDTDIWKNLMTDAHKLGMLKAVLTGGECLTYPGFDDIYIHLWNMGIRPVILSNGVLIDDERLRFFKRFPPSLIQVTVYGNSEDEYERVTGHRCFHIVYDNIRNISDGKLPIRIAVTPNRFMSSDYKPLLKSIRKLDIPFSINSCLISPRDNTKRAKEDISVDQYIDIYKTMYEMDGRSYSSIDYEKLPEQNHSYSIKQGFLCGSGRSSFCIKHNGVMCPCETMDDICAYPLRDGFVEAWSQICKLSMEYTLPLECGNCIYNDRCLICPAMHKNAPQNGHCDPRICERTKKIISVGLLPAPNEDIKK